MFTTSTEVTPEMLNCIRRWGSLNSDAILDDDCSRFYLPELDGLIGYKEKKGCAVVYGDPVCSKEQWERLTDAFHEFCKEKGLSVVYLMASASFAEWATGKLTPISMQYGKEVFIDPHDDPREKTGTHASLVRRKVRHAQKEGILFFEYTGIDLEIETQIENVGREWLKSRKGVQVYISHLNLFNHRAGKRWFYAVQNDKIVGVIVLHRLEEKNGWHFNHLMILPEASNGTPELLVIMALETIKKEGSHYASFGVAPAQELGKIEGLSFMTSSIAKGCYTFCCRYFHLDGFDKFWGKFDPSSAESYLLFSEKRIGLRELLALKAALNISLLG